MPQPTDKCNSIPKIRLRAKLLKTPMIGLIAATLGLSQRQPAPEDHLKKQLQEAYAKHDAKIRQILPPYAGPPLLLDISHMPLEDGMCDPDRHSAWESHFSGMALPNGIVDRGVPDPTNATTTTLASAQSFSD